MNWNDFKQMPISGKMKWLLHYYTIPFCAVTVSLIVIVMLLCRIFGTPEQVAVKVLILDDRISEEEKSVLAGQLEDAVGEECELTMYHVSEEYQYSGFVVRLTGDEIDVIIAPKNQMMELKANGYFREMFPLAENCAYYQAVDPEELAPEKNLYFGITGVRELKPGVLEAAREVFCSGSDAAGS